ncbi:hypothetical protein SBRCBS47491_001685 [Sporothrix bragantina]|uniref:C6 zinc finger domain containing protein n=1 Tax=Sporothrix bragantina TaxID=671064 RepID=A0ABP0B0J5_9PEZI
MAGAFMFVDGRQNDRLTKRRMRRHVMQGKNAGKTIHRPSRIAQGKIVKAGGNGCHLDSFVPFPASPTPLATEPAKLSLTRRFGSVVTTIQTPVAMTPVAWQTIDDYFNGTVERVYAPGFGVAFDLAKPIWFQSMFADEAAYHCTLALMQASNEAVLGTGTVTTGSLVTHNAAKAAYAHHVGESLAQLNRRLAGPLALANSTIFLVLLFISQEQMRHESLNARIHVAGLGQMVALRGGLEHFETRAVDRPLLLKICKIDIVYALQFGVPPLFHRDVLGRTLREIDDDEACRRRADEISRAHHRALAQRQPVLYSTFRDVLTVSLLFEGVLPARPIDMFTFGDIFMSMCYRLMKIQADMARDGQEENIYQLGMMMFSMTLFLRFDQGRLFEYRSIGQRFRNYLEDSVFNTTDRKSSGETTQDEEDETRREGERGEAQNQDEACFWILMMGSDWTLGSKQTWQGPKRMEDSPGWQQSVLRVRQVSDRLGLEIWEDARAVLAMFPWLTKPHEQPGRKLWEASRNVKV